MHGTGLCKSLFVPPSAAERAGKVNGDTPYYLSPGQGAARGYRPCTPFATTFQ